jgi:hypothetical protein
MKLIKIIFKNLFILLIILIFTTPLWLNKIPLKYFSNFIKKVPLVDKYACQINVQVSGDAMSPLISQGANITLNRCFSTNNLSIGTVILYDKNSESHLSVIRHILNLNPIVYKISNEQLNQRLQDIIFENIVAISNDFDINNSSYQPKGNSDSFLINPKEYISELYLGKIPRGVGIEIAKVEKTDTFSKNRDKFCLVISPKKELNSVNTEIIDTNTQKIVKSSQNFIINNKPNPNINCQDFGPNIDNLNLDIGSYRYRFLLNYQVLADIPFSVE